MSRLKLSARQRVVPINEAPRLVTRYRILFRHTQADAETTARELEARGFTAAVLSPDVNHFATPATVYRVQVEYAEGEQVELPLGARDGCLGVPYRTAPRVSRQFKWCPTCRAGCSAPANLTRCEDCGALLQLQGVGQ